MIKWPNNSTGFYDQVLFHARTLQTGTVVAIDPSSGSKGSMPGYAVYREGALEQSGIIQIPLTLTIEGRLRYLHRMLVQLDQIWNPALIIVEDIAKAMASPKLLWAVGVTLAAFESAVFLALPIPVWKAVAKTDPTYTKGDEADAIMFGRTVIAWARENLPVEG